MNPSSKGHVIGAILLSAAVGVGGLFAGRSTAPAPPAPAPASITLPAALAGEPGDLVQVQAEASTDAIDWDVAPPAQHFSQKTDRSLMLVPKKAGVYTVTGRVVNGTAIARAQCVVTIAGEPVPPTPPGPVPPGPTPPGPPAPIPAAGLRVLVIYDSATLPQMPPAQQSILYAQKMRDFLNAKCVVGADGKTHEWRMWPQDIATGGEAALWQTAMKRPHAPLPWLLVSNGKAGFEGPLPATVDEAMALIQKYAE